MLLLNKFIISVLSLSLLLTATITCYAQADSAAAHIKAIPDKYIKDVDTKMDKYDQRITDETEKTLKRLSHYEDKIHALLLKVNPQAAQQLFGNNQLTFNLLLQQIQQGNYAVKNPIAQYDGYTDSLSTTLKYIDQQKQYLDSGKAAAITVANDKSKHLDQSIDNSAAVQQFIKQRKKQLFDESVKYIGDSKYLMGINKESYYYVETLKNYKELFSDPDKTEKMVTDMLSQQSAFQNFFQSNSIFASLFPTPGNYGTPLALAGLQTRSNMQQSIQGQIASGGPNAQAAFEQNMQQAQDMVGQLKTKLQQYTQTGNDMDSAFDFKPNGQESKTFLQRLEYGTNMQTQQASYSFPVTTDLGLSIGYKLNDKNTVGVGASYKMGFGSGLQHISISAQGIGLRSFLDINVIKSFYASGGLEYNYQQPFSLRQIPGLNNWQQSGLIGVSKIVSMNTKLFKKAKMQLLWDFLSYEQVPRTNPIKFRIGYNF